MLLLAMPVFSQFIDYTLVSSDNELGMELSRAKYGINITLLLYHASAFEFVSIEKSAEQNSGFRQCKYIALNGTANDSIVIVQRDIYPLVYSQDVFYRVKTVSREGVTRIYPPVRMPGSQNPAQEN